MKTSILTMTAAAFVLTAGIAHAGNMTPLDEPPVVSAPPAPAMPSLYDWSGAYAGLGLSYGEGNHRSALQQDFWPRGTGFGANALAGYNWQMGSTVFGIEGHVSADRMRGTTTTGIGTVQSDIRGMASLRGRVGIANDRTLVFASAGPAAASIRHNAVDAGLRDSQTTYGLMVGVGVEQALGNGFHIRGDLEHYRFNSQSFNTAGPDSFPNVRSRANVARVSTVFRF